MTAALPRDIWRLRPGRRLVPAAAGQCDRCAPASAFCVRRPRPGVCQSCGFEAAVVDLEAAPDRAPLPAIVRAATVIPAKAGTQEPRR